MLKLLVLQVGAGVADLLETAIKIIDLVLHIAENVLVLLGDDLGQIFLELVWQELVDYLLEFIDQCTLKK